MSVKSIDELRADMHDLVIKVREERDELNVQMHLAKAEIRDEWEKVEPQWEHLQTRAHAVGETAGEASKDVVAAVGLLGREILTAYERIRKAMHS